MSQQDSTAFQPLDVVTLPLHGRHLIEASAGTGKTFNITRLYLRLLLEQQLSVQQILVMTFTNAATEEIRGRIAQTLTEALTFWQQQRLGQAPDADPIFARLYALHPGLEAEQLLQAALLEMDDASVYTIHGFCNRVLGELAFAGGAAMQLSLSTDTRELYLQAARDWIRTQARDATAYGHLMTCGWHTPERLLGTFESAIRSPLTPQVINQTHIEQEHSNGLASQAEQLTDTFAEVLAGLQAQRAEIEQHLVYKGKDSALREEQWADTLNWVEQGKLVAPPESVGKFIHGNRLRSAPELKAGLAPLKDLISAVKAACQTLAKQRDQQQEQAPALAVVASCFAFIRNHVARQKAQQGIVDFDDLIAMLAQRTESPDTPLAKALREKFPAALVDEFQDTDANQYQILANMYPADSDNHLLLMIGDPKQAIYGFRGGDIFTYLQAGKQAAYRWVMDTNYRSVADMVSGYNRLFYGAPLDGPPAEVFGFNIGYEPVNAADSAKANNHPLSDPADDRAALTYAIVQVGDSNQSPAKHQLQQQLASWVAAEIVRLLDQAQLGERALAPQDIAILVRSGNEARIVQAALRKANLASVFLSNRDNLFSAHEAQDLYRVLDGIWHYQEPARLTAALSSALFGLSHQTLVDLLYHNDDALWDALMERVVLLRTMWLQRGCMTLILHLLEASFAASDEQMERKLTNYLHLAEVLEREAAHQAHPDQLLIWLHRQISEPALAAEQVQRLESDAHLIQLVTQHGSKGLEYPVVFVPFASDYRNPLKQGNTVPAFYRYYNADQGGLALQLGQVQSVQQRVREEGDAEAMRLLYVAVTRAAHRCYLGVAPFDEHQHSPLAKALGLGESHDWAEAIERISQTGQGHTGWLDVAASQPVQLAAPARQASAPLRLDTFDGDVTEAWRLYSFSALARRQQVVNQTRREQESVDEPLIATDPQATLATRFAFEKGASAGNLLHDILEHTDFSQPDWEQHASQRLTLFGVSDEADQQAVFAWLDDILQAPLDPSGLCLADLPLSATLREAEFYFPLEQVSLPALNRFLIEHRQAQHADTLLPRFDASQLEGMMHGFIDLIFCHEGRYYVADYKSTHLGNRMSQYAPARLRHNNQAHLYDLQYLIYAAALHRYLQHQLPGYDPKQHFGGVYYLYLRGMHPDNQEHEGIFFTRPDAASLNQLSAIFGPGGSAA